MAASFAAGRGRIDGDRLRRGRPAAGLHPSAARQGRRHRRAVRLHLPARHDEGGRRLGRRDPPDDGGRGLGARRAAIGCSASTCSPTIAAPWTSIERGGFKTETLPHGEAAIATPPGCPDGVAIEALVDARSRYAPSSRLEAGVAPLRRDRRIARAARLHPPARHEQRGAQPGQPPHRHQPRPQRLRRLRAEAREIGVVEALHLVATTGACRRRDATASRSARSRARDRSRASRHGPSRDRRTRRCRRDRR